MKTVHFTEANLTDLSSCFLDPKGNFIFLGCNQEIGVHEELAYEICNELYGDELAGNKYSEVRAFGYMYEYLESIGYYRFSHWIGKHGVFSGESRKMSHAQKLAIRAFCKVNSATWDEVL